MKKQLYRIRAFIAAISIMTSLCFCSCISLSDLTKLNSSKTDSSEELPTADRSVLTERQKEILAANSLPTDIDELSYKQKAGIMDIEDAFLYLDEKYPGVEFEYGSHMSAGLMNTEYTKVVPAGYDRSDDRNVVTVSYDRDGNCSDDYMLVVVREAMENVIIDYLENYFGKDNFKVYVHPMGTDLEFGDEISEETVIGGNVRSVAELLLPDDICSEEKLNEFAEAYRSVYGVYRCRLSATITKREDFDNFTYENMYDDTEITIIYNLEIRNNK